MKEKEIRGALASVCECYFFKDKEGLYEEMRKASDLLLETSFMRPREEILSQLEKAVQQNEALVDDKNRAIGALQEIMTLLSLYKRDNLTPRQLKFEGVLLPQIVRIVTAALAKDTGES